MATDKLKQAEKHQFIEKFDQKLQEHLKLRTHNTLRFDELQQKYSAMGLTNQQLEQHNRQLQERLDKTKQELLQSRQQYELLKAQVISNSPAQYSLVSRQLERELKRLQELLEQKMTENKALIAALDRQGHPRSREQIQLLREQVRSLNESIEKVSLSSRREPEAITHLRMENEQLKEQLRGIDHGSHRSSQHETQLTQKIKVLELQNTDLRNKLALCRDQLKDVMTTQQPNPYDKELSNRNNVGKTTNSMKEFFTLGDRDLDESLESSKGDLIDQLKSQNGVLRKHLQETNKRFQQQMQVKSYLREKFNDYIDKLTRSKTAISGDDRQRLGNLFRNMSLYFKDFTRERQRYQQKIVDLMRQIVRLNNIVHSLRKHIPEGLRTELRLSQSNGLCRHISE